MRSRWIAVSIMLALTSMVRYPGGTPLDATTAGYSLTHNFLSDLGMTVAYNGQPNRLGAGLFVASLVVLIVTAARGVAHVLRVVATPGIARAASQLAGAFVLLACFAFTGVAVTPENLVMPLHVSFTFWAWRMVAIVAVLLGVAFVGSGVFRRRVMYAWAGVAGLLIGYAALITWGPTTSTNDGLVVQVLAQKVATLVVISGLLLVTREAASVQGAPT